MPTARLSLAALALFAALCGTARAQPPAPSTDAKPDPKPEPKLVAESWEVAMLEDARCGYVHFSVREEIDPNGNKVVHATKELSLSVLRGGQVATIRYTTGTAEDADGEVLGVLSSQRIAAAQTNEMVGVVKGGQLEIEVEGNVKNSKKIPFPPATVSLLGESKLLKSKGAKPGDTISYLLFEPTVLAIVRIEIRIGELEETTLLGGQKRKLLKYTSTPAPIGGVQLPPLTAWADPETLVAVKSQAEMPGLGTLTLYRASKEIATAPPQPRAGKNDLITGQSIRLGQRVDRLHALGGVVYSFKLQGDKEPITAFPSDARQKVRLLEDGQIEVDVTAIRRPGPAPEGAKPADKEFLESNYFINSADARVRDMAAAATRGVAGDWNKALAIEKFVRRNMRSVNLTEAMATADEVARTLAGDCSEHAMLAAAMCRAAGVPSRTAVGLVYVDHPSTPTLAFHMWTEVYVDGQWLAIDATRGDGGVGPGHVKVGDHSWFETRSVTPLLPVMRVLVAKPTGAILSASLPAQ